MEFMKAARTEDIKEGGKKIILLGDKTLLLTHVGGEYYAIDNRCTHMGGSLYDGVLSGDVIKCPRHGTQFDVKTGKVVQRGKIVFIPVKASDTRAYPVKVEGEDILIGIE